MNKAKRWAWSKELNQIPFGEQHKGAVSRTIWRCWDLLKFLSKLSMTDWTGQENSMTKLSSNSVSSWWRSNNLAFLDEWLKRISSFPSLLELKRILYNRQFSNHSWKFIDLFKQGFHCGDTFSFLSGWNQFPLTFVQTKPCRLCVQQEGTHTAPSQWFQHHWFMLAESLALFLHCPEFIDFSLCTLDFFLQ